MKFPIIITGDWVELAIVEAETREEALMITAKQVVEGGGGGMWISPKGISGDFTPNATLEILDTDCLGNECVEVVLTSPSCDEEKFDNVEPDFEDEGEEDEDGD